MMLTLGNKHRKTPAGFFLLWRTKCSGMILNLPFSKGAGDTPPKERSTPSQHLFPPLSRPWTVRAADLYADGYLVVGVPRFAGHENTPQIVP